MITTYVHSMIVKITTPVISIEDGTLRCSGMEIASSHGVKEFNDAAIFLIADDEDTIPMMRAFREGDIVTVEGAITTEDHESWNLYLTEAVYTAS